MGDRRDQLRNAYVPLGDPVAGEGALRRVPGGRLLPRREKDLWVDPVCLRSGKAVKYVVALVPFVVGLVVWSQAGLGWSIVSFFATSLLAGTLVNAIERGELRRAVGGTMEFEPLENVDGQTYQRAARIRALQGDYALLNAEEAPTLAEAEDLERIRQRLRDLGSDVDWDLCDEVKRGMGVSDTRFNTRRQTGDGE